MITFTYRGFTGQGELIEENELYYVIAFEGDQRSYLKELANIVEIMEAPVYTPAFNETLFVKDGKYIVRQCFDKKFRPRKNGVIVQFKELN